MASTDDQSEDEREPIAGQVASILTDRQLVINRGTAHGVEPTMRFAVLNRNAVEITDPETGESLGSAPVAKVLVEARLVEERFTVCSTFRTKRTEGGSLRTSFPDLFAPPRTVHETLRREDGAGALELDEEQSIVGVGDQVVEVWSDDYYPLIDF